MATIYRQTPLKVDHRLSIAPMMEVTDRHFRYFMRLITKKTVLYTEMVPCQALYFGNKAKFLEYHPHEKPLVLQVGGDNPDYLAYAAQLAEEWGYDEVNLNCGCPSPRVQSGNFGVVLMHDPKKTALLVKAMRRASSLPVSVKHRLGTNEKQGYDFLRFFVENMLSAGVSRLIVHARVALLNGHSPKENREIPPLQYEIVYRLKEDFPEANIHLNGGVQSYEEINKHLNRVDGVMVGRKAQKDPYFFAKADNLIFQENTSPLCRKEILQSYLDYVKEEEAKGEALVKLLKPLLALAHGQKNGRLFRQFLVSDAKKLSTGERKDNFMRLASLWEKAELEKEFTA